MKRNRLITTAIAAQMLGFTRDYIRQLCADGEIKADKLGHDWIFPESAIKHIKRKRQKKDVE